MSSKGLNHQITYLKSVHLNGYRCIQNVHIDFNPGLNLIIGRNGTGKTNFLNFLDNTLNFRFDNLFDFRSHIVLQGDKVFSVETKRKGITPADVTEPNKIVSTSNIEYKFDIDNNPQNFDDRNVEMEIIEKLNFQSNIIKHGLSKELPIIEVPFKWIIDSRGIPNISFTLLTDSSISYFIRTILASLFFKIHSLKNSINKDDVEKNRALIISTVENILSELKNNLNKYSPINDIRLSEGFGVFFDENKQEIAISNFVLEYKVNDSWLPYSSLSDGTRRIFLIIADLSVKNNWIFRKFSFGQSAPNLVSRIVLIEEPELGIHPHQLHLLMTFLKEQARTKQIILTTHSPQVLDVLGLDEFNRVIVCELNNQTGTELRHMTSVEISKAQSYINDSMLFSDYWRFSDFNRK